MSESTSSPEPVETRTAPISTTTAAPTVVETDGADDRRPRGRLAAVAAWVGIVAGTVFIVAVIFFTGFVLGMSAGGGHHGGHEKHGDRGNGQWHHDGGPGPGRGWQGGPGGPDGPGGPGGFGPGGPGERGPGGQGPGQAGPQGGPAQTPPTR